MKSREAAYLALLSSLRQEGFVSHFLEKWQQNTTPSSCDFALAQEIAFGTARSALTLDYLAANLVKPQNLSLKLKERALVRTAIYQYYFMSKVPLYAIVNETIEIAKKYCHRSFVGFLNALLRKLSQTNLTLPKGDSVEELSIRFSYPGFLIKELINDYGKEKTLGILNAGNQPAKTMARFRPTNEIQRAKSSFITRIPNTAMTVLNTAQAIYEVSTSPDYYIQNITPATLIAELAKHTKPPSCILDLCASPGGKLLAAHDQFPSAKLYGNDVTREKISRLQHNFDKYRIPVNLSCGPGESFSSTDMFDLIILDVPCSNSGVLNKRPEARWRISQEALTELTTLQKRLIANASSLLSKDGVIWYLTCSILKEENENIVAAACKEHNMTAAFTKTVLPDAEGVDGGFACLLHKNYFNEKI